MRRRKHYWEIYSGQPEHSVPGTRKIHSLRMEEDESDGEISSDDYSVHSSDSDESDNENENEDTSE